MATRSYLVTTGRKSRLKITKIYFPFAVILPGDSMFPALWSQRKAKKPDLLRF